MLIARKPLNALKIVLSEHSVMSHKYVPKFMWDILVQLSSIQVSGRRSLAAGYWHLASGSWSFVIGHLLLVSGSASSKKPEARSLK
jgi:hypothetical protein